MNVERLTTICKMIEKDFAKTGIVGLFANVVTSLQQIIQNPNNPSIQQNLTTHLSQIKKVIYS